MADLNSQTIEITIQGKDFEFNIDRDAYNAYVNGMAGSKDKVQIFHNFLVTVVNESQQDELSNLLKATPNSEVDIAAFLLEQYTPDLGLIAKKRKPTAK